MRSRESSTARQAQQRSSILKLAEYTSVAASAIGAVFSAATQQVAYTMAPLSLSLFLNLVNRQRFEQQTQQRLSGAIAEIDQHLSELDLAVEQVEQQFFTELHQQIAQLDQQIIAIQPQSSTLEAALSQLEARVSQRLQHLSREIEVVREQIYAQTSDSRGDLSTFQSTLAQLQDRVISLESLDLSTLNQDLEQQVLSLGAALSQLQTQVSAGNQQLPLLNQQLSAVQQRQLNLEHTIAQVETSVTALASDFQILRLQVSSVSQRPVVAESPEEDQDLEILALNLGIDFGTSFTKVCFRDIARDRSEVVTFADGQPQLEDALLTTKIGILSDGTLVAGLTAVEWAKHEPQMQTSVEYIKMRLAKLDISSTDEGWQLSSLPEINDPETLEDLCAYYLSQVVIRAQSWIQSSKADLLANQKLEWVANIGVPVAYCDSPAIARFKKVLSLAWLLSQEPQVGALTLKKLRQSLRVLRQNLHQQTAGDCCAVPEIAAEVWSFLNSREVDDGFYVLLDVGDGTMDGGSFRFWRDEGEKKVDFYVGKVNALGVSTFSQLAAAELGITAANVQKAIAGEATVSQNLQYSQSRKKIQQLVAAVVIQGTRQYGQHHPFHKQEDLSQPLRVFVAGGGAQTSFYPKTIKETHRDFNHEAVLIPPYALKAVPIPKDLEMNGLDFKEFHRFAVAYGLSIPDGDQPEVRLPSQMADLIKNTRTIQPSAHSPLPFEDTRDYC